MIQTFTDINSIVFEVWNYPMSYIECFGTLTGLLTVWLAAKANWWTWPTGLLNNIAFFAIFYQVQLYSDMLLQIYFFVVSLYGWWNWRKGEQQPSKAISVLSKRQRVIWSATAILSVILLGAFMSRVHMHFPALFSKPASYPYADAFTAVLSIIATVLMANKRIECWVFWILVDVVSIGLYAVKGIHLIALEYAVFLIICLFGVFQWIKLYTHANRTRTGEVYARS